MTPYWVRWCGSGHADAAAITSEIGTLGNTDGQALTLEGDVPAVEIARDGFFGAGSSGYADAAANHI